MRCEAATVRLMSATNRGTVREDLDAYFSPLDVTRAIMRRLLDDGLVTKGWQSGGPGSSVLEPSVGKGAFVQAAIDLLDPDVIDVVDLKIRPEIKELDINNEFETDFLSFQPTHTSQGYSLILGNPPYSEAEQHIRHAMPMLASNGRLAFLLRLNFLEGKQRHKGFWKELPPEFVYVLDKRPSFTTRLRPKINKKTGEIVLRKKTGEPIMVKTQHDSIAYGVFVWRAQPIAQISSAAINPQEPIIRFLQWRRED